MSSKRAPTAFAVFASESSCGVWDEPQWIWSWPSWQKLARAGKSWRGYIPPGDHVLSASLDTCWGGERAEANSGIACSATKLEHFMCPNMQSCRKTLIINESVSATHSFSHAVWQSKWFPVEGCVRGFLPLDSEHLPVRLYSKLATDNCEVSNKCRSPYSLVDRRQQYANTTADHWNWTWFVQVDQWDVELPLSTAGNVDNRAAACSCWVITTREVITNWSANKQANKVIGNVLLSERGMLVRVVLRFATCTEDTECAV